MVLLGQDFWKSSGWHLLDKNEEGYLNVTEDFIAAYFERPELIPIEESCSNERDLHKKLTLNPTMKVENKDLEKFKDKDSAFNYQMVLNFRDFILQQLTLETALVNISKGEKINFPPLFVSQIVHVIVRSIVDGWVDPIHLRVPFPRDGFNKLLASIEPPLVAPAPITVCISSINRTALSFFCNSLRTAFNLSSKSPLYLVPARRDPISRE